MGEPDAARHHPSFEPLTAPSLDSLRVELFSDGADLDELTRLAADPRVTGFTTNPTLMRKAGVADYEEFARAAAEIAGTRPISFEVFTDHLDEMVDQALTIAGWGDNVFVKIPVTDTLGASTASVVARLVERGVKVNVTAITTVAQVREIAAVLASEVPAFVSVFAGRIADTGIDPVPIVAESVEAIRALPRARLIWSSPREVLNVFQADAVGCHVITVTPDLMAKFGSVGKDLLAFSRETVQMFHDDAAAAGFAIRLADTSTAGGTR